VQRISDGVVGEGVRVRVPESEEEEDTCVFLLWGVDRVGRLAAV